MSACKTVPTAVHNSAQNNSDNLPLSSRPPEVWYLSEQHFYTPIATVLLLNNQHGQRVKISSDNEFQTAKHNTNMSVCWTSAETPLADDFSVALHVEPASHLLTAFWEFLAEFSHAFSSTRLAVMLLPDCNAAVEFWIDCNTLCTAWFNDRTQY